MSLTLYLAIVWLRLKESMRQVAARLKTALQKFATQEPVRLRAALTSLAMAGAVLVPTLADPNIAQAVGASAAVILPILVGESARRKVTPSK